MTKPTNSGVRHAADSQSIEGHSIILKKSLSTAHHADALKPARPTSQPVAQTPAPAPSKSTK
jgi:hypothetical protein